MRKNFLVTGAAGFIGFHLCKRLLNEGHTVVGIDNVNDYYDVNLKYSRLYELGIEKEQAEIFNQGTDSFTYGENFHFVRLNIEDRENLPKLFKKHKIDIVCNLAAQAGVRYSLENPEAYIDSNVVGFLNLLECCRKNNIQHLVYASSSSVYGQNQEVPFTENDNVDRPISLYAATKKSNELMAHTYSHLYNFKTTGLRFFTVYGPWGRPDMAMFLFTDAILQGKPIKIFNHGNLERDFTYIDDIIEGIFRISVTETDAAKPMSSLYNIGNSKPERLMDFINEIESQLGILAMKDMMPMQAGDVSRTWADVSALQQDYGYNPQTPIKIGIGKFVNWFQDYYKSDNSPAAIEFEEINALKS